MRATQFSTNLIHSKPDHFGNLRLVGTALLKLGSELYLDLKQGYFQMQQRRVDRDAFKTLISLDDKALKDIGVNREDVIWASKLPLSYNAALELENLKKKTRAGN